MVNKRMANRILSLALAAGVAFTGFGFYTQDVEAASLNSYGLATNIKDGNILHCFDWTYQQIIDELPNIAEAGFTSVQTSPAQPANASSGDDWYQLYQPNGFWVGDAGLGSENDLKRLCSEADKYGIKIIVDVVANHLSGDKGTQPNIDPSLKADEFWHDDGNADDYTNRYKITHGKIGMRDLNSEHSYVQQKVKSYVAQLKADGVDGIRWDAAKHISLPSEQCGFWSTVIDKSMFNYGEILGQPVEKNDSFANSLMSEYTDYMSVTDSLYSSTVMGAIKEEKVPKDYGNWTTVSGIRDDEVVYFAETHDTYSNNTDEGAWTKYIDQNKVDRAYAIVASKANSTALYYSRPYQTGKYDIHIGVKGSTHFTSDEVAAVNKLHNQCDGEKEFYTADGNVAVVARETGATLVLGSGSDVNVSVTNPGSTLKSGTYKDLVSGGTFTVTGSSISGNIGGTGIAVLLQTEEPPVVEKHDIYVNVNDCSWFLNDNAVPVCKSNKDSSFSEMTATTIDGKTVYTVKVPDNASSVTVARKVGSKIFNEKSFSLGDNNYFTSDSNWSNVTGSKYTGGDHPVVEDMVVYFTNNDNWDNVYAYTWGGSKKVNWPGEAMTFVKKNEYNQDVYKITVSKDITGLIFTNGNGQQTVDIKSGFENGLGYYISGNSGNKATVGTYTFK